MIRLHGRVSECYDSDLVRTTQTPTFANPLFCQRGCPKNRSNERGIRITGVVLESFWNLFGVVLKSFWGCLGFGLGSFWRRFEIILVLFCIRFGVVLDSFWNLFGIDLCSFGVVLGSCWDRFWDCVGADWGSFWDRFGVVLGLLFCRVGIVLGSFGDRSFVDSQTSHIQNQSIKKTMPQLPKYRIKKHLEHLPS